jgi:hypothetical protein
MQLASMLAANRTMLERAKTIASFKIEYHLRSITIFFYPLSNTPAADTIMQGRVQKTTTSVFQ